MKDLPVKQHIHVVDEQVVSTSIGEQREPSHTNYKISVTDSRLFDKIILFIHTVHVHVFNWL